MLKMDNGYVVVTGGAGFIGSHLVERLLREGSRVVVMDDCSTGRLENLRGVMGQEGLSVIPGKISEYKELPELLAGAKFIFHLAAAVGVELVVNSPIHVIHTNLQETEAVLAAAAPAKTPVLITSTSEVYGKSQKDVFSENDDLLIGPPQFGRWSYACSKLMDEFLALAYARQHGLPVTIVRLFNTVGPRQTGSYGMVLPRFIAAAKRGEPLRVHGDGLQSRCFCYVLDTVEALIRLQKHPEARGAVYNIGGTEEVTILELAERVIAELGSESKVEKVTYQQAYAPGFEDMRRRTPSVEKLLAVVGFAPRTSLKEIIQLTAAGGLV